MIVRLLAGLALTFAAFSACGEESKPLLFGAVNQRSVSLTAQAWNPILDYVSRHAGVPLALKIGKTAPETTAMTVRGEHAFAFTKHMYTPERVGLGYRAILRLNSKPIHGIIVVRDDSPVRTLKDLDGKTMVFPSTEALVGYHLPLDHLTHHGVKVNAVFAGNQEGAIAQLEVGKVAAAGVNKSSLEAYTRRKDFSYRVLWVSEPFVDTPIMVNPSVPPQLVEAVRAAFLSISSDPDGRQALQASANAIGSKSLWSFVPANDDDYDNYRRWYARTNGSTQLK